MVVDSIALKAALFDRAFVLQNQMVARLPACVQICVRGSAFQALRLDMLDISMAPTALVRDAALVVIILVLIPELHLYVKRLRGQVLSTCDSDVLGKALRVDIVKFLVVDEHLGREPLQDPLVADGLVRRHPLLRIPLEAALSQK